MPVQMTYPGVYIQEIPSGQHTISGVATSITAFVGRALLGPINEPLTLFSFGDFQRQFGGLANDYPMSYAVQDFFLNGGSEAIVTRVYGKPNKNQLDSKVPASDGTAKITLDQTVGTSTQAAIDTVMAALAVAYTPITQAPPANGPTSNTPSADSSSPPATPSADSSSPPETPPVTPPETPPVTPPETPPVAAPQTTGGTLKPITSNYTTKNLQADMIAAATAQLATYKNGDLVAATSVVNAAKAADATSIQTLFKSILKSVSFASTDDQAKYSWNSLSNIIDQAFDTTGNSWLTTPPYSDGSGFESKIAADTTILATVRAEAAKGTSAKQVLEASLSAVKNGILATVTNPLILSAASKGLWGNFITVSVDTNSLSQSDITAGKFNLSVTYAPPGGTAVSERFINLSIDSGAGASRLDRTLTHQSNLVNYSYPTTAPATPKPGSFGKGIGGADSGALQASDFLGSEDEKTGIYALDKTDIFNLLCIPPDSRSGNLDEIVTQFAAELCYKRRAILLIDPPTDWTGNYKTGTLSAIDPSSLGIALPTSQNAAVYYPRVIKQDMLMGSQPDTFPACGIIAGVIATTDLQRGVWKAPAGQNAGLNGIVDLEVKLNDNENGILNPVGINCLRSFPIIGPVVWGARTLAGADQLDNDYKYLSVRRLTLFIEESLYRGTKWAVFEPNAEPLWSSLRLAINGFMSDLSRQGAFYSYQVVCDKTTTTQDDIDKGIVNILVAFAPVKPAEFVNIMIQQQAGQTS